MPVDFLKYQKDKGMISVKIEIENVPIWNYTYKEDMDHDNDTARNDPKEHSLGKPHELKRPIHEWRLILTNPANVDISASVRMRWYQEVDGIEKEIHSWKKENVKIQAENAELIGNQVILFPS